MRTKNDKCLINHLQSDEASVVDYYAYQSQGIDTAAMLRSDGPVSTYLPSYLRIYLPTDIPIYIFTSQPTLYTYPQPPKGESMLMLHDLLRLSSDHRFNIASHVLARLEVGW